MTRAQDARAVATADCTPPGAIRTAVTSIYAAFSKVTFGRA
jgi:hypothetical protein